MIRSSVLVLALAAAVMAAPKPKLSKFGPKGPVENRGGKKRQPVTDSRSLTAGHRLVVMRCSCIFVHSVRTNDLGSD